MKFFKFLFSIAVLGAVGFISSCSNNDEPKDARLQVVLVDAPAEYSAVWVDVQGVTANFGGAEDDNEGVGEDGDGESGSGWTEITSPEFEPGPVNLLELVNGSEEMLADESIPVGTLSEIRLLLGDNNLLVMGDQEMELTVPSGSSSGLKIKLDAEIRGGITYKLILDFDAAQSVVATGSGKFNLKPVIHASMEAQTGAISGSVSGLEEGVGVVLYAIQGEDSISTYPGDNGQFLIQALAEGTYDVVALPDAEIAAITVEDIGVVKGEVSSAGDISFE